MYRPRAYKRVKDILSFFLLFLLAYSVGKGVIEASGGASLGSLFRIFLPSAFYFGLFAFVSLIKLEEMKSLISLPDIKFKQFILLAFLAVLLGYPIVIYGLNYGLTNLTVGLIVISGIVYSFFLVINGDDFNGFCVFMLTLPFLFFLEWDQRWIIFGEDVMRRGILISPSAIIFGLFSLLILGKKILIERETLFQTPVNKYIAAFAFFLLVSSIVSTNPVEGLKITFLAGLLLPLFFLLVINIIDDKEKLVKFIWVFLIFGFLKTSIYYYFFLKVINYELNRTLELYSVYFILNSLIMGVPFLMMPLLITLLLITNKKSEKLALTLLLIFFTFVLFNSQLKSSLVILVCTSPFILKYKLRSKYILLVFISIAIISIPLFYSNVLHQNVLSRFAFHSLDDVVVSGSYKARIDGWTSAVKMMINHPFVGIGTGLWEDYIHLFGEYIYKYEPPLPRIGYISSAHHMFLHYGAEAGIGAMLSLILLAIGIIRKAIQAFKNSKNDIIHALLNGTLWCFMLLILQGLTGGYGFTYHWLIDGGLMFWIPAGLVIATQNIISKEINE